MEKYRLMNAIGLFMVLSPFVAVFAACVYFMGLKIAAVIFLVAIVFPVWMNIGIKLSLKEKHSVIPRSDRS